MMRQATTSDCLFVGPFPGPIHGQSVATLTMARLLEARELSLTFYNDSGPLPKRAGIAFQAARRISFGHERVVYLSVNANKGMALTAMLAATAKRAGKKLFLHHHSYRYIARKDRLMALLAKAAGRDAMHICNCPVMEDELRERYPLIQRSSALSNVGSVDATLQTCDRPARPVTIGHFSNLTREKGIGRVVDAAIAMVGNGIDTRLEIAGPAADEYAKDMLAKAATQLGSRFRYHGPVRGAEKQAFFDVIDIFAFPSLYPTETQGIVNLEAMACGKPVVAFSRCCIASDIGSLGGVAIPEDGDFTAALIQLAQQFTENPGILARNARLRYDQLLEEHAKQVDALCDHIFQAAGQ